jgi:undecaprenyl diphosphate synthase
MIIPKHIAIIPDGNRRWARKRGLPVFFGHRAGVKALDKILKTALDLKIAYFTFWGTSKDNIIKRSKEEVFFLFKLFKTQFKKLAKDPRIHKNKIRVNVIGEWPRYFPAEVKNAINEAIEKTKYYDNFNLTFLMAYSGKDEMLEAIRRIANRKLQSVKLEIDEELIKNNLWTKDLPSVDLIIRTGGEPHNSDGFMMWDTADSQYYFTDTLWPDFTPEEFQKAIEIYSKTERRFGA